jgi:acyl-CoA synthetase (AMP-forming)/AMP-acid ligase II
MTAADRCFCSLVEVLERRCGEQAGNRAYVFLSERGEEEAALTFGELERRAHAVATELIERNARAGDRALLVYPPGLDFIVAFFGCLLAGVLAVPIMLPRRASSRDASLGILADCAARFLMTNAKTLATRADFAERFEGRGAALLVVDGANESRGGKRAPVAAKREDLAFLQYTSGSTSNPKGVMVSHGNLLSNLEMIRLSFGNTRRSTCVGWVPHYHDMGLVVQVLQSLYVGALCVLMAPTTFLQRPLSWLRAIHRYRGEVSCAPNFAFDLCAARFNAQQMQGVDLSSWKLALNGAEPIRAETLQRFSSTFAPYGFDPRAMYPGYGMAEATLLISSGRRGAGPRTRSVSRAALQQDRVAARETGEDLQVVVGCGQKLQDEEIAIVDPQTRQRLAADRVGEIWVRGPHVAQGYWCKPEPTARDLRAVIEGEPGDSWLRSGDLGFLDRAGELYVTGRIKDVIIVRGVNHYPQDIEYTAENSHPAFRLSGSAAFTVTDPQGAQKVVLVQEVARAQRGQIDHRELEECIREAVASAHDVAVHSVVLIRPGALPKTTSGKVQRHLTRRLWEQGALEVLDQPQTAVAP